MRIWLGCAFSASSGGTPSAHLVFRLAPLFSQISSLLPHSFLLYNRAINSPYFRIPVLRRVICYHLHRCVNHSGPSPSSIDQSLWLRLVENYLLYSTLAFRGESRGKKRGYECGIQEAMESRLWFIADWSENKSGKLQAKQQDDKIDWKGKLEYFFLLWPYCFMSYCNVVS